MVESAQAVSIDSDARGKELEELRALLASPGWAYLVAYWKSQFGITKYVEHLEAAKTIEEKEIAKGIFNGLKELVTWPESRIQQLENQSARAQEPPMVSRRGRL